MGIVLSCSYIGGYMEKIGKLPINSKYLRSNGETYIKIGDSYHVVEKLDMQIGNTWIGDPEIFNPDEEVEVIENR